MTTHRGKPFLFHSSQKLLSLGLRPMKGISSLRDALQGPSTSICKLLPQLQRYKGTTPPSRTTYANLGNVFVENALFSLIPKIGGGGPLGPLAALMCSVFVMVYEVDEKSTRQQWWEEVEDKEDVAMHPLGSKEKKKKNCNAASDFSVFCWCQC